MHDDPQSGSIDHSTRMLTGFMVGALVGAGIALLLAPATGEETRRKLGETARRLRDRAEDGVGRAREKFDEIRHGMEHEGMTGREDLARESMGGPRSNPSTTPGPQHQPRPA